MENKRNFIERERSNDKKIPAAKEPYRGVSWTNSNDGTKNKHKSVGDPFVLMFRDFIFKVGKIESKEIYQGKYALDAGVYGKFLVPKEVYDSVEIGDEIPDYIKGVTNFDVHSYECRYGDLYNRSEFDEFMNKVTEEGYMFGPEAIKKVPVFDTDTGYIPYDSNTRSSHQEYIKKITSDAKAQFILDGHIPVRDPKPGDNIEADMESDTEVICRTVRDSKDKPLLTDPKGLENGYFIRQHTNPEDSSRYTLMFNPGGTVKTRFGENLPYVIECYGNNYDGMTRWAVHVFITREDMVAALNYDLKLRDVYKSKNFGDSIGGLNLTKYVFPPENTTPVFAAWMDTFGESFIKNMTSRNIFSDGYFGVKQVIKTFRQVFISEKTGALVVMGLILDSYSNRNRHFVWFSDTEEILYTCNPLYEDMENKILSKFYSWDRSELRDLAFFNEDESLDSEFITKRMRVPDDSTSGK